MEKNICPECKTENEPEYEYCKNCGAVLNVNTYGDTDSRFSYASNMGTGNEAPGASPDLIDGNTVEQVITFVGKNPHKFVPKFIKMQKIGTKADWCWPPFVLGFLFGPTGTAIWFLYRKMYSFAAIFGAIGIAANYFLKVLNYIFHIGTYTFDSLEKYLDGFSSGTFDYEGFISAFTNEKSIISFFVNSFYSAIGVACAVLAGIFGIYLYKRHTAKSIARVKAIITDGNYMKFALSSKGGTSVGAVVVGLLIISFLSNLPDMIYGIIKAVRVVLAL